VRRRSQFAGKKDTLAGYGGVAIGSARARRDAAPLKSRYSQ